MRVFKFDDVIQIRYSSCKKCFSMVYSIPCEMDKKFPEYMKDFGKVVYPLNMTNLIKIKTLDNYEIETKLKSVSIKFKMPKRCEGTNLNKTSRKLEFEKNLSKWVEDKLEIKIDLKGIK